MADGTAAAPLDASAVEGGRVTPATGPPYAPMWLLAADVRKWLRDTGTPPTSDDVEVDRICAMAETYAEACRPEWATTDDAGVTTYTPDAETYQGAMMLAAKTLRRRNSPSGVETFGDVGISFVAKHDPEVSRCLRTDAYQRPGVG